MEDDVFPSDAEQRARDRFGRMGGEELGRTGERIFFRLFEACGYSVVKLSETTVQGAPLRHGENPLVLPDAEIFRHSPHQRFYVEIKAKRLPGYYQNWSAMTHGVDQRNYEHYASLQGLHRECLFIAIFECFTGSRTIGRNQDRDRGQWSGNLLLRSLAHLGLPCLSPSVRMAFWRQSAFGSVGQLSACQALFPQTVVSDQLEGIRTNIEALLETSLPAPVQTFMF